MHHLLLSAVLAPLIVSADAPPNATTPLEVGTQLAFRGTVEPRAAGAEQNGKSFELTLWIVSKSETGAELLWLIDERGRGAFPWSERFGRASVNARWQAAAGGPAVLYDRGDGRSVVPVPLPLLSSEQPLAAGAQFREGDLDFQVESAAETDGRAVWEVVARDAFGPKRRLKVDRSGPLVTSLAEKVVMGRGLEYELRLEFVSAETLQGENLAALVRAADALTMLRGKLNLPPRTQEASWKEPQIELLRAELPKATEAAAATPLERITVDANRDLKLQSGRSDAVAELAAKFNGHAVEEFAAKGLDNCALARADLAGKVTVLHFWEYRDEPLTEPYGQVGYLDFMYHRREAGGLRVFGVAVDGRLADDKSRSAAERSVRRLKSFMNLSYPVLLDAGALVKQFGDPRLLGASLPLFVVIGPDGTIRHYHVGHYDVHQDQGLKELDDAVGKALEAK
ncbi:MAG: TlpA disulfide reductase family protein [Pirellulales bacterium]